MKHFLRILVTLAPSLVAPVQAAVDFNEDVRPILNKNCTACHGGVKQAGGVSFILRAQALGTGKSGAATVVPGRPEASELIRRVTLPDADGDRMPPREKHPDPLTAEEIGVLTRWIQEGAEWGEHWAYVPPQPQQVPPETVDADWPARRIDHFVLAGMRKADLSPSPEAAPREWLRRVSFALVGLPPREEWLQAVDDQFDLATRSRVVDALLADPAFGERWAAVWMDLARYADSMGYERDPERTIWPYRDWLIRAFNDDLPYGDFVVKQLAGDQLPHASANDFVATGFLRNSQTNTEGGTDDEEFRIAALVDRVGTAWTAMQGVTMACVQCHSHPYDPFPHKDFYRFAAYLNNTADADLSSDYPTLKVSQDTERADQLLAWQRDLWDERVKRNRAMDRIQRELSWHPLALDHRWTSKPQVWLEEVPTESGPVQVAKGTPVARSTYELIGAVNRGSGTNVVEAVRVKSLMQPGTSAHTPSPAAVVTGFKLRLRRDGHHAPLDEDPEDIPLMEVVVDDANGVVPEPSWGAFPNQFTDRWVVLVPKKPLQLGPGDRLGVVLDQRRGRDGGAPPVLRRLSVETTADTAVRERLLTEAYREGKAREATLTKRIKQADGVHTPVLLERRFAQRVTAEFNRGNFLDKGDEVAPALPRVLAADTAAPDRLAMAEWFADPDNPLAARVWVNRVWAQLFGIGLVETQEDFGSTGTAPSHPALLDDLAWRFSREHHASLKSLLRELVLSATYLQTASTDADRLEADPRNRLLSRGPRNRLTAEMVRDHALAAAGLLSDKRYGPPVMPPQPDGIWNSPYSGDKWKESTGEDRYRRGIYTHWRRSAPYPAFETFDAPERKVCAPRRIATNTPLQALVTLNDPVYVEAAQAFARRIRARVPDDPRKALAYGYELATTRTPAPEELDTLTKLLADLTTDYRADPQAAAALADTPADAALVVVANALLNTDAALNW